MSYLVMETHPAYAVMLDQEGRFLKAANLHYQVGDTVATIVELRPVKPPSRISWRPLAGLASLAACLYLVFFCYYQPNFTPYGILRLQINPDVEMTVSRTERILKLEGRNEDGEALIAGYSCRGKDRETATEELMERAIHMGYLSDGDTVSIAVSSDDDGWRAEEEARIQAQMEERCGETIIIRLGGDDDGNSAQSTPYPDVTEVVIPVKPSDPGSAPPQGEDDDNGESDDDDRDDDNEDDYEKNDDNGVEDEHDIDQDDDDDWDD